MNRSDHSVSCISETFTSDTFGQSSKGYETIDSHDVEDRNSAGFHKRKQTSQKRSMFGGKHVSAHVHISPDTDQFYPQADVSYTENGEFVDLFLFVTSSPLQPYGCRLCVLLSVLCVKES